MIKLHMKFSNVQQTIMKINVIPQPELEPWNNSAKKKKFA